MSKQPLTPGTRVRFLKEGTLTFGAILFDTLGETVTVATSDSEVCEVLRSSAIRESEFRILRSVQSLLSSRYGRTVFSSENVRAAFPGVGYSTHFSGKFELSRKLTASEIETIRVLSLKAPVDEKMPESESPWVVSEDGRHLEDVRESKMSCWDVWLEHIVEAILEPAGVGLQGRVFWQGEDVADCGAIFAKGNQVRFVGIEELPEPDWSKHA